MTSYLSGMAPLVRPVYGGIEENKKKHIRDSFNLFIIIFLKMKYRKYKNAVFHYISDNI